MADRRDENEPDERAVYIISVAAELAGVHPQTLRIYERKGLVRPKRTEGNNRRYSARDIRRLQAIQALTDIDRVGNSDTRNDRFHDKRGWISVIRGGAAPIEVVGRISPGYRDSASPRQGLNYPSGSDSGGEGLIDQRFG